MVRQTLITACLAVLLISTAQAERTSLTCRPVSPAADVKVPMEIDLDERWLKFGEHPVYDIVQVNDSYLTAVQRKTGDKNVGGEVLVLNRLTGEVKRASVFLAATPEIIANLKNHKFGHEGKLVAHTYLVQCSRRVL